MRKGITLFLGLIPINKLKIFLLRLVGHKISYKARIGFSILFTNTLELKDYSRIGHFNFIKVNNLCVDKNAFIKNLNYIKGPFSLVINEKSGISNQNKIRRANRPITYDNASLVLGVNTFIVSNHFLDLTRSIYLGDNSILAGIGSQLWTHGYYHADQGSERIRIDGEIHIGSNVYIGSACVFNPGVCVGDAIHLGAGSVVSKDLTQPGMYVGQALRYLENTLENVRSKLKKVENDDLIEKVYTKN